MSASGGKQKVLTFEDTEVEVGDMLTSGESARPTAASLGRWQNADVSRRLGAARKCTADGVWVLRGSASPMVSGRGAARKYIADGVWAWCC